MLIEAPVNGPYSAPLPSSDMVRQGRGRDQLPVTFGGRQWQYVIHDLSHLEGICSV
jgi:hypothetical protein